MAYMDGRPGGQSQGETVVLLHGGNYLAAAWEGTMDAGFRVVAMDQIGYVALVNAIGLADSRAGRGWNEPQRAPGGVPPVRGGRGPAVKRGVFRNHPR